MTGKMTEPKSGNLLVEFLPQLFLGTGTGTGTESGTESGTGTGSGTESERATRRRPGELTRTGSLCGAPRMRLMRTGGPQCAARSPGWIPAAVLPRFGPIQGLLYLCFSQFQLGSLTLFHHYTKA